MRIFAPRRQDGAPPRKRGALSALLAVGLAAASLTTASIASSPAPAEAAPAGAGPAWTCSAYGYLFQTPAGGSPQIYQVDLVTGQYAQIGATTNLVNAMGYNQTDNYMYGWNADTGVPVIVAADGTQTALPLPSGIPQGAYVIGDVDRSGHYWIIDGSGSWFEIDYANGSATYGQVLSKGTANFGATNFGTIRDWTYIDGSLYGVTSSSTLVKFDTATKRVSTVSNLPNVPGGASYGATYSDASGYLYASNNVTGEIYRIDPRDGTAIDLSSGPPAQANDGARCSSAKIPTVTVQKTVDGRADASDQFTVSLVKPEGDTATDVTTTGSNTTATSVDWPVSQGRTYTITDRMARGSTNTLDAYAASIVCTDTTTGAQQPVTAGATAGTWTFNVPGPNPYLCNVTNSPADPSYTVSKTADKATAYEGDVVKYTVTVKNTGNVTYTNARPASFTDDLSKVTDDATYNADASGGASVTGNTLSWSGPLAVGETKTITYSVTVNKPDTGDKVLTNAVTPTGPGGDCDTDPTKTCSTNTPVQSYTVEKTADQQSLAPGKKITYTVTVKNTGKVAYTADNPAAFTDDLSSVTDDATYNGDATNGAVVDGNTLTWKGPLAVGSTTTIKYSFTVNDPDTGDKTLKNGVVTTSPGGGCAVEPCEVQTPVGTYVIKKTADKTSAKEGDTVTWTVSVQNTGKADADASFTDDLSKVLDDATYNKDAQASAGTLSYDQPNLSWSGTVPVGQTVTITYSATVNTPDTGDRDLNNVITSPYGCKESGAICETDTPVQQFRVTKTADTSGAQEGDTVTYTVTVENTGKVDYTDTDPATFTDDMSKVLDDATYNGDAKASAGTVSYDAPKLNWTGPLAVGDTATVTYTVKVNTPDAGDGSLDNVVVSPGCYPNDPDCEVVVPVASYTVAKQADKTTAKPGDVVHYTVTVTNTGEVAYTTAKPATFTDDLSKVTDDATYNGDASNGATVTGNTLSWSGALGKGQTITVTYSFTVNNPDTGDMKLVNVVDPGNGRCATDGGCTTNTSVTPTPPTPHGPTVATGGTAITGLGVWPMVGAAGASIAVLLALLTMTLVSRRRNGDSA